MKKKIVSAILAMTMVSTSAGILMPSGVFAADNLKTDNSTEMTTTEVSYKTSAYDSSIVENTVLYSHTDKSSEVDFDEKNYAVPSDSYKLSCEDAVYDALGFSSAKLNSNVDEINKDDKYKDTLAGYTYVDPNEFMFASVNTDDDHYNIIKTINNMNETDISTISSDFSSLPANTDEFSFTESKDYQTRNLIGIDCDGDGTDELAYLGLHADKHSGALDISIHDRVWDGDSYVWSQRAYTNLVLAGGDYYLDITASEAKGYTAMTAGDFDGDGKEELAFYAPTTDSDNGGVAARVYIADVSTSGQFDLAQCIYLRDIDPACASMSKDWYAPVVSLSTTKTRLGAKDEHASKTIDKYDTYEDLVINISAPKCYSGINLNSFTAIYGYESNSFKQLFKTEYKPFSDNGNARMTAVNSCDADLNGDGFDELIVAGVRQDAKSTSDSTQHGDYNSGTNYVNVISNTDGNYFLTWSNPKVVAAPSNLDPNHFTALEPIGLSGGHYDGSTGSSFDQICVQGNIFKATGTKITGTPTYAEMDSSNNTTYAVIPDTLPGKNKDNLLESSVGFEKVYSYDITSHTSSGNHPWVDQIATGHFLSAAGVDTIAVLSSDDVKGNSDQINMDISLIAYAAESNSGSKWKEKTDNDIICKANEDDKGTSLAIAFVNNDNDTFHYKYRATYTAYSAPELYTVMQTPPYYAELNGVETKYTMTTGVDVHGGVGLGLNLEMTATMPLGPAGAVKASVTPELGFSAAFTSTNNKTTTQTISTFADKDYAIVYTIPEVVNIYDVIVDETGEKRQYQTYQPLSPEFAAISVDDYNAAVDKYSSYNGDKLPIDASTQKIEAGMLPKSTAGDPVGYTHSLKDCIDVSSVDGDMHKATVASNVNNSAEEFENSLSFTKSNDISGELSIGLKASIGMGKNSVGAEINGSVNAGKTSTNGVDYTIYYKGIPKESKYGIEFDDQSGEYNDGKVIEHYSTKSSFYNYTSNAVAYKLHDVKSSFKDDNVYALSFYTTGYEIMPEQPDEFSRKSIRVNADGSADITLGWNSEVRSTDRAADGYNIYFADINSNMKSIYLMNKEGVIHKSSNSKYTTYTVHLDAGNYGSKCTFYIAPVFNKSDKVVEGTIDKKCTVDVESQTNGNVIITSQPQKIMLSNDGKDEDVTLSVTAHKKDGVYVEGEKLTFYWLKKTASGLETISKDVVDIDSATDSADKTSTLKFTVKGAEKSKYADVPVVCRVVYGNYSVYSDVVTLGLEKASEETQTTVKAVKIKSIKSSKKKQATVNWSRNKKANGYQVQYRLKGKSKYTTITIKKNSTLKKTVLKLKSKKTYQFRVRAYVKNKGKKVYSKWSKVKSVKIR